MSKKIQRVTFKDSAHKPLDVEVESYSTLELTNNNGVLVWEKGNNIIPHDVVLTIVEMETPDEPVKEEQQ